MLVKRKLKKGMTYTCWWDDNGFHEQFDKPLENGEPNVCTVRIADVDFTTKTVTFEKVENASENKKD